jgi:hypothetical protein
MTQSLYQCSVLRTCMSHDTRRPPKQTQDASGHFNQTVLITMRSALTAYVIRQKRTRTQKLSMQRAAIGTHFEIGTSRKRFCCTLSVAELTTIVQQYAA